VRLRPVEQYPPPVRRPDRVVDPHVGIVEPDPKFGLVKVNPLVAWTSTDVWTYVHEHDVPYNPLHERGYPSIGCWPCTTSVAPGEDPRAGRWRGQEKTECGLHTRWATGQKKDLAAQLLDLDEEIQWRRNAYLRNFWQQAQRALGFAMEGFEVLYDAWRREVLAYLLDIPASQLPPLISINDCIKRSTGPWYVGSLLRSCSPTGGRYQEKQGKQSRRCWQWLA